MIVTAVLSNVPTRVALHFHHDVLCPPAHKARKRISTHRTTVARKRISTHRTTVARKRISTHRTTVAIHLGDCPKREPGVPCHGTDGPWGEGLASWVKPDQFEKAVGRKLALGRALQQMFPGRDQRVWRGAVWEAYLLATNVLTSKLALGRALQQMFPGRDQRVWRGAVWEAYLLATNVLTSEVPA